ncbi:ACT domain-containing protein,acetyltransferase (GNAT) family protein [Actinoalloteichus sp. GBA129-24]|nr:ACT domain-containing protein,acetyltransferase (GNAT) family protein [Actinoalloteichus sp. GBA129-24]
MPPRVPGWAREALELAGVFFAAAVAHVFAGGLAEQEDGPALLMVTGAVLVAASVLVRAWHSRRGSGRRPAVLRTGRRRDRALAWIFRARRRRLAGGGGTITGEAGPAESGPRESGPAQPHPAESDTRPAADGLVAETERGADAAATAASAAPSPRPLFVPTQPGAAREAVLWRLRVSVEDRPGRLAFLTGVLAGLSVDIRSLEVHPTDAGIVDELLVDAPTSVTAADLAEALLRAGGTQPHVVPADRHELTDPPARALGLAARIAADPDELVAVLADLLDTAEIRLDEVAIGESDVLAGTRLTLAEARIGTLRLSRPDLAFTPAEFARARALRDLAVQIRAGRRRDGVTMLAAGREISVEQADRLDLAAVRDLHRRCSPDSRFRRYRTAAGPGRDGLRRLLTPGHAHTLLARDADDGVIAMACLVWRDGEGELGLLVRDDWQRRGLGTMLARELMRTAEARGARSVHAYVQADNLCMIRIMNRVVPEPARSCRDGILHLTADLQDQPRT